MKTVEIATRSGSSEKIRLVSGDTWQLDEWGHLNVLKDGVKVYTASRDCWYWVGFST